MWSDLEAEKLVELYQLKLSKKEKKNHLTSGWDTKRGHLQANTFCDEKDE